MNFIKKQYRKKIIIKTITKMKIAEIKVTKLKVKFHLKYKIINKINKLKYIKKTYFCWCVKLIKIVIFNISYTFTTSKINIFPSNNKTHSSFGSFYCNRPFKQASSHHLRSVYLSLHLTDFTHIPSAVTSCWLRPAASIFYLFNVNKLDFTQFTLSGH